MIIPLIDSNCEKHLGSKIDQKLSFKPDVESVCKKASQKLRRELSVLRFWEHWS